MWDHGGAIQEYQDDNEIMSDTEFNRPDGEVMEQKGW